MPRLAGFVFSVDTWAIERATSELHFGWHSCPTLADRSEGSTDTTQGWHLPIEVRGQRGFSITIFRFCAIWSLGPLELKNIPDGSVNNFQIVGNMALGGGGRAWIA